MVYYFNGRKAIKYENEVANSSLTSLTLAQYDFALLNPQANETEILAMALTPQTAEQLFAEAKQSKMNELNFWTGTQLAQGFVHSTGTYALSEAKASDLIKLGAKNNFKKENGVDTSTLISHLSTIDNVQVAFNYTDFNSFASDYSDAFEVIIVQLKAWRNDIENTLVLADFDLIIIA